MGAIQVFVEDLAKIKFGIMLREVFFTSNPSFNNKVPLTSWMYIKPNYTSTQRHTIGMWSLPLLNDELDLYPDNSRFVCPSVEINKKTKPGKE